MLVLFKLTDGRLRAIPVASIIDIGTVSEGATEAKVQYRDYVTRTTPMETVMVAKEIRVDLGATLHDWLKANRWFDSGDGACTIVP